uniref:Telomeric single stranded DNA binding POT1/Cdc13 domain-containing protein n=1 Tax=Clastoptera arizonana TaxID=38151 RepID=A0A1B6CDA1_9HEMI
MYGNRFRVILFGNKAIDSVTKNLAVADQLIFVDPLVVTHSNYEVPANIHQVQLECGTEVNTKERIFLIKKLNNSVTGLPDIITSQINNSDVLTDLPVIQLLENEVKELPKLSKDSKETIQNTHEINLVKDNFKCKPLYPKKNSTMMILNNNEICMDTKYDYIKVSDITKKQYKVNVYTIVVEINEVTTSFLNTRITFKAIDETCKGDEHIIITIIFDKYDEMQNKIKPNAIVRLHRMKISSFNGILKGTVYKGSDVLVVPYPTNSLISSAKKVSFTSKLHREIKLLLLN